MYERVHGSLPTIKATQRQTRNKMWPRKTPGGPSETFRVLKLRPTEQFNKIGAERRDSLDQLMTARNGAPLHDSDNEDEEIWDVDGVEFDQHGRRIKTFAKTPKEYYGRNGRATPNYNNNNNMNNNGSGKKKRGRPRKNPTVLVDENDDDDGQQQQHQEEEQNEQVRGKHIRLAPDTDDEDEEDERDDELEENTRRNSEAIHNNNHDDDDDQEAEKEANEAARMAELELEEEREEEARKASKAKEDLIMEAEQKAAMELKITQEEIPEEEEEEEEEDDEESRALKKRLADAEAELDALDAANEAARKMLDQHDERDSLEEDGNGDALPPSTAREKDGQAKVEEEKTSRFSMSLGANKGVFYDEEADKDLIENDPAIKSGSINLEEDLDDGDDDDDNEDDDDEEDRDVAAKRDSLSSKSEEENDRRDNDALAIPMDLDE